MRCNPLRMLPFALSLLFGTASHAAPDAAAAAPGHDDSKLRICAAADELPFSHRDGSGFENKIATALAEAMGRQPQFVWFDKASIYIVRDQLDKRECDIVIGVDSGDPRVLTTQPYYRSGYVFVQKTDSPLKLEAWSSPDIAKVGKIGFVTGTPAETMVRKVGLYESNFNYAQSLINYKGKRNQYLRVPPQRLVSEVADGTADVAVHFAPEVARYVKQDSRLKMTVIPDDNVREDGEKVPHHYNQSMGVRLDDKDLLDQVQAGITKAQSAIDKILADEGIPALAMATKGASRGASIETELGPEFE